jgi:hypothetical protein
MKLEGIMLIMLVVALIGNEARKREVWWGNIVRVAGGIVVLACVALHFLGCAAAPPPPPQIIVKHDLAPKPRPVVPPDPYEGMPADEIAAIKSNSSVTLTHGITRVYRYDPNQEYKIYVAPLQAVEIQLPRDETVDDDNVILGDSKRWDKKVGDHVVLIRALGADKYIDEKGKVVPGDYNMVTNLVINGSQHSYHFLLTLRRSKIVAIAFYFPDEAKAQAAERESLLKSTTNEVAAK